MNGAVVAFILAMWGLILAGGGISVLVLGPISVSGFGDLDGTISSGIQAVVAILLVVAWVFVLSKVKNWIFKKQLST